MSKLIMLRQRAEEHKKSLRAMLDAAEKENRDLNESEGAKYDETLKTLVAVEKNIEREEALVERERKTPAAENQEVGAEGKKFANFGEQLLAVRTSVLTNGRSTDPRLVAGPAGLSEAVPSGGGFLVQKDFSPEILERIYQTGEISSRCRRQPIGEGKNGIKINAVDEDSRADGSRWGGVQAFFINEAGGLSKSRPKFREIELQLEKLAALYYATDEELEDAVALGAFATRAFGDEMAFKLEDSILNGSGAGTPLGVLNSGAVIIQAKEAAQAAATIVTANILNMWSRMWAPSRKNAAWFIDQSVEPQLFQLVLGAPALGQILLYAPPGKDGNKYGLLMGRPVIPTEHNAQLGTQGDIILADMDQYLLIDKGGVRQDYSMHVNFLTDEGVFRFIYRVDGESWWKKPLTPKSGGPTQSPFIALQSR